MVRQYVCPMIVDESVQNCQNWIAKSERPIYSEFVTLRNPLNTITNYEYESQIRNSRFGIRSFAEPALMSLQVRSNLVAESITQTV